MREGGRAREASGPRSQTSCWPSVRRAQGPARAGRCARLGTLPAAVPSPSTQPSRHHPAHGLCPSLLPSARGAQEAAPRARLLPSDPGPRAATALASRADARAQSPSPGARWRPGAAAILTQAREGDGGVVLGAGLLGAVRVWAEAGGRLPAVVRLLLLRGHGQAALPAGPAGGLPRSLGGAPAQDGLNGEAGDAAGRRTPLARIFLAAHPGFIRNRRKPRTPFRDGRSGRWCGQAGGGEGRGEESGGGGGEAGEAAPPRGGRAGTGRLRRGPCPPGSGCARPAPARTPLLCPPALPSPAARRRRGLICIEVTGTWPIAAPRSGPGNFQKAEAGPAAPVLPAARRQPGGHLRCPAGGRRARAQHRLQPGSRPPCGWARTALPRGAATARKSGLARPDSSRRRRVRTP